MQSYAFAIMVSVLVGLGIAHWREDKAVERELSALRDDKSVVDANYATCQSINRDNEVKLAEQRQSIDRFKEEQRKQTAQLEEAANELAKGQAARRELARRNREQVKSDLDAEVCAATDMPDDTVRVLNEAIERASVGADREG